MINPAELVDNFVSLLRAIPDLVTEMDGDPDRIYAYHDHFPKKASLVHAIHAMPAPGRNGGLAGNGAREFRGLRRLEAPGHALPAGAPDR